MPEELVVVVWASSFPLPLMVPRISVWPHLARLTDGTEVNLGSTAVEIENIPLLSHVYETFFIFPTCTKGLGVVEFSLSLK